VKRFVIVVERRAPPEPPWRWVVWDENCVVASGVTQTRVASQRVAMAVRKTLAMVGAGQ